MKTLVIGGTGPTGPFIVRGLVERGHEVAMLNRGSRPAEDVPASVERIQGDPHFQETLREALGRRRFDEVVRHIAPVRYDTHLFGGSHAQRDVIALTLVEAALATEDMTLARALAAERIALKPSSRTNRRFLARAGLAQ